MRLTLNHLYAMTVRDHEPSPTGSPAAPYVHVRLEKLWYAKSKRLGKIRVARVRTLDDCAVDVPATALRTIEQAKLLSMTARQFDTQIASLRGGERKAAITTTRTLVRTGKAAAAPH